ncbi:hypothetical protein LTR85_007508 [Meristemomyces frigidus]|nr:hypothetical protein LTR85_007508 [Meristemomyces frigidus]
MSNSSGVDAMIPVARPGWFDLHDLDERGIPRATCKHPAQDKWKFRSLADPTLQSGAMHYQVALSNKDDVELKKLLLGLRNEELVADSDVDSLIVEKMDEVVADLRGKTRLLRGNFEDLLIMDYDRLISALPTCEDAVETVVHGHAHPDADAVCAAWAESIPPEVAHILGRQLCDLLSHTPPNADHALVLVDCQQQACANPVKAVIDHHPRGTTYPYYVAQSYETSWSSILQVYIKLLGSGFDLDPVTAKMLAETTILEAEPELMHVMGKIDRLALERLRRISAPMTSYPDLMAMMTESTDRSHQFSSDYKEDDFGFAVVQCRRSQPACFEDLAQANNVLRELPMTIVKQELADRKHVISSLTDKTYVELLDTYIANGDCAQSTLVNGGQASIKVNISPAKPAQIHPQDCDQSTGLPQRLVSPDAYEDRTLWRYWSPDSERNVATRGHIFVLDRPCIDLKISPEEATRRLTFRPIYKDIPNISYDTMPDKQQWVQLVVRPRLFSIFERPVRDDDKSDDGTLRQRLYKSSGTGLGATARNKSVRSIPRTKAAGA